MQTKANDSAYPYEEIANWICGEDGSPKPVIINKGGLTKREYFATKAPIKELLAMYMDRIAGTNEECALLAVEYADALIKQLNKEAKDA